MIDRGSIPLLLTPYTRPGEEDTMRQFAEVVIEVAEANDIQRHLRARTGDVAPYVLIPGDPGRAERIAQRFTDAREVARNREYVLFTGETERGVPV